MDSIDVFAVCIVLVMLAPLATRVVWDIITED